MSGSGSFRPSSPQPTATMDPKQSPSPSLNQPEVEIPTSSKPTLLLPEPSEPSDLVVALTRLADLEAQMEFAFAKHVMVMNKGKDLRAQYELLESLPVGIDSIQDELDKTASQ